MLLVVRAKGPIAFRQRVSASAGRDIRETGNLTDLVCRGRFALPGRENGPFGFLTEASVNTTKGQIGAVAPLTRG